MLPDSFTDIAGHTPQLVHDPRNFLRRIESVSDFFDFIQQYAQGTMRWWLRGEPQRYPQPCLPTFSRRYRTYSAQPAERPLDELELVESPQPDAIGNPTLTTCLTVQELEIIRDFQQNAPEDEYFERMVGNDPDDPGWMIFAQHYGAPTRLLDVTSDPLVALYFACNQHEDDEGVIWCFPQPMDAHGPHRPRSVRNLFDPAIHDRSALAFHAEGRLDEYRGNPSLAGLIDAQFLYPFDSPNRRVLAQRGSFIWAGNPLWHLTRNVFGFAIPAESKNSIMNQIGPYGLTAAGLCLE